MTRSKTDFRKHPLRLLPLLASMVAITPLAIDMYLPAMPVIAKDLQTTNSAIQVSLSLYLAGYALGMLIFGPLADRLGRRKVSITGLIGFIICSVLLAFTEQADVFLGLRFTQAVLGSGATVVVAGIIRDLYGEHTSKGLSYVSMIMMVAPLIAPAIGSLILEISRWQTIFLTLAAYALLILILVSWKLPSCMPEKSDRNWFGEFFANYKLVFSDLRSVMNIVSSMLGSFAFFCYITAIAFVYIEFFKVSESHFSILFGINVLALLLANIINSRFVVRLGSQTMLTIGLVLGVVSAGLFVLISKLDLTLYYTVAVLFPIIAGLSLVTVNSDSQILTQFPQQTGTATAVIGTLRFGSGAFAGVILSALSDGTPFNLAILMFASLLGVLIAQLLKPKAVRAT
ncbi:multidrug effflux MFS transporter [Kangiella sp. TOML190]|uniref:multidrug effflux MFS transporter n=1 Tax=Kangiella sp. TOML190 TaxID=2931351 RepID=UPI002040E39A|nr:multidrug effflux MFS transporter [Kangiella sp. TOML190]